MNPLAAKSALVIVALAVLTSGCGQQHTPGRPSSTEWPEGRAFLSTSVTENGMDRPLAPGTRIMLTFGNDGQLGAQAGCNHIGGTATIVGNVLTVNAMSMTEMACDEPRMTQDGWLADFLSAAPTIRLSGDELTLTGSDVRIEFIDRRIADPDLPLAGTEWVVDTVITGTGGTINPDGAASSVPAGLRAYLVFDGRGGLTGSTGCKPLDGTADVAGNRITITLRTVPATCAGRAADLHRAVLATLAGEVTYRIEGPGLTLLGPSGAGLGLRASAPAPSTSGVSGIALPGRAAAGPLYAAQPGPGPAAT